MRLRARDRPFGGIEPARIRVPAVACRDRAGAEKHAKELVGLLTPMFAPNTQSKRLADTIGLEAIEFNFAEPPLSDGPALVQLAMPVPTGVIRG